MKLAIFHPFLVYKGGAERVVLKIAQHYNAKIFVVEYNKEKTFPEFEKIEIEKIPTINLPLPKRLNYGFASGVAYFKFKLKEDFDVINAHGTPSEWGRIRNKPVVWYCHTPNREAYDLYQWRQSQRGYLERMGFAAFTSVFRFVEKRVVPKIEYIFANSYLTKERLKKYLNADAEVLHPGVEYDSFYLKSYENFFFYPSRIAPEKRIEMAINAFQLFKKRSKEKSGFKLIISGSLAEERKEHVKYFLKIKSLAKKVGDVEILTNISDKELKDLYARCYSVIFTAKNEDFGLVPLEAGASYKPIIAVNEGGPKETIKNGVSGFLADDEKEIAEKMDVLVKNYDLAKAMGRNGRRIVEKEFSWKNFFRVFDKRLREVAKMAAENKKEN